MGDYISREGFIEDIKTEIINLRMDGLKGTPRSCEELYQLIDRIQEQPAEDVEPVRYGHWVYKHKVRGGIRYRTGEDSWGNMHTIQCDDRYEEDAPYCSECHKLNDGSSLNYCPNCGAKMNGGENYV